ncbi:ATP-dependent helicase HrpB [Isoalcanivorax beigongshangi]|uniref:ATP-dependent helicase HrpB n=1 Tax=Isoalcanivorax beigongshangi TaxID=3238810 RepID=A0ABV4AG80_9GAMM
MRAESNLPPAPIDAVLPQLLAALADHNTVILEAPPGAGKTTRVPLALRSADWLAARRILMLEPRRVAARSAARYMAQCLGEPVGKTVGYRTRMDTKVSAATRIEVVTEGVLTRLLQADPELADYGAVLFDEFHERSLHGDLGLALARESQQALRPDLRLLLMSATLDGERLAQRLAPAPVIRSAGRQYPVTVHYRAPGSQPWLGQVAPAVLQALAAHAGSLLVFLPGQREIRAVQRDLAGRLAADVSLHALYGDLSAAQQDQVLAPAPAGQRKVVLATAIAETSLTIEGISVVVDAGYQRRAHYDPASGTTRLVTERVSEASAVQRSGRAGRLGPGVAYRLWAETERLADYSTPDVLCQELSELALELAVWGCHDPSALVWLDLPPAPALAAARRLLTQFGAIAADGRVTDHGRRLHQLPLGLRAGQLWLCAEQQRQPALGAALAALLSEADPLRQRDTRIATRLGLLTGATPASAADAGRLAALRALARRLSPTPLQTVEDDAVAALLAQAWPDRIAQRRPGDAARFRLSHGRGAWLAEEDPLAAEPWLVVPELDGDPRESRIYLAAPITQPVLEQALASQLAWQGRCHWNPRTEALEAVEELRLGALVLAQRPLATLTAAMRSAALAAEIRRRGIAALPWDEAAEQLRARQAWLHRLVPEQAPAVSDEVLLEQLESWLGNWLGSAQRWAQVQALPVAQALAARLDWTQQQQLQQWLPERWPLPSGRTAAIDYRPAAGPVLAAKLQELFGLQQTPVLAQGRLPVTLHLLSPAGRPVAITQDLAGFWRDGYFAVRKDLRGRYPRHPWPEDPLTAQATARARPRA